MDWMHEQKQCPHWIHMTCCFSAPVWIGKALVLEGWSPKIEDISRFQVYIYIYLLFPLNFSTSRASSPYCSKGGFLFDEKKDPKISWDWKIIPRLLCGSSLHPPTIKQPKEPWFNLHFLMQFEYIKLYSQLNVKQWHKLTLILFHEKMNLN